MPEVVLHLKAENLKNEETFGTSDPFFQVEFGGEVLFRSKEIRSTVKLCEWEPATFELPDEAVGNDVTVKIMDKDVIVNKLMNTVEISYPFRRATINLEGRATLTVLNDHGSFATKMTKGKGCWPCFKKKAKKTKKEQEKEDKEEKDKAKAEAKAEAKAQKQKEKDEKEAQQKEEKEEKEAKEKKEKEEKEKEERKEKEKKEKEEKEATKLAKRASKMEKKAASKAVIEKKSSSVAH